MCVCETEDEREKEEDAEHQKTQLLVQAKFKKTPFCATFPPLFLHLSLSSSSSFPFNTRASSSMLLYYNRFVPGPLKALQQILFPSTHISFVSMSACMAAKDEEEFFLCIIVIIMNITTTTTTTTTTATQHNHESV